VKKPLINSGPGPVPSRTRWLTSAVLRFTVKQASARRTFPERRPRGVYAFFAFGGTMASFAALATRNFTTFFAAILMAAPVAGFRPIRALRSTRTSRPIPGRTNKPFFLTSVTAVWASVSNRLLATFLVISHESARVWTICVCVS
jgi:hypothetical protein